MMVEDEKKIEPRSLLLLLLLLLLYVMREREMTASVPPNSYYDFLFSDVCYVSFVAFLLLCILNRTRMRTNFCCRLHEDELKAVIQRIVAFILPCFRSVLARDK